MLLSIKRCWITISSLSTLWDTESAACYLAGPFNYGITQVLSIKGKQHLTNEMQNLQTLKLTACRMSIEKSEVEGQAIGKTTIVFNGLQLGIGRNTPIAPPSKDYLWVLNFLLHRLWPGYWNAIAWIKRWTAEGHLRCCGCCASCPRNGRKQRLKLLQVPIALGQLMQENSFQFCKTFDFSIASGMVGNRGPICSHSASQICVHASGSAPRW